MDHRLNSARRNPTGRIVCHGDSLTEGADVAENERWTSLLADGLGVEVTNTGIGGDTSGGMLARFSAEVIPKGPDITVVMGGTNDLWWNLDVEIVLANIFSMVCQSRSRQIQAAVALPFPISRELAQQRDFAPPLGGYDNFTAKQRRLTAALGRAAREYEVPAIDLSELFLDTAGAVRREYYLTDGLHANPRGHRAIARAMAQVLRPML